MLASSHNRVINGPISLDRAVSPHMEGTGAIKESIHITLTRSEHEVSLCMTDNWTRSLEINKKRDEW